MKKNITKGLACPSLFKISLKMKLTTLLLIVSLFEIHANSYSQNTKVSLNLKNATVEQVFREIESKTEFKFLYKNKDVELNRKVSILVKKKNINEVLDELFKGTKIDFKVYENRQVILSLQPESKAVDQKKSSEGALISDGQNLIVVSGIVINERGELLAGANIKAKGSSVATQTAANSSFSIKVPDNVTKLVVSYIGMEEQEVAIGKSPLTIVLKEIGQKMDEVVLLVMGPKRRPILQDLFQTLPRKN